MSIVFSCDERSYMADQSNTFLQATTPEHHMPLSWSFVSPKRTGRFRSGFMFLRFNMREEKMTPMVSMPSCYTGHKSLMDFPKDVTTSNRQHRLGICRVQRRLCFNPSYIPQW
jgi:hypothetical protein